MPKKILLAEDFAHSTEEGKARSRRLIECAEVLYQHLGLKSDVIFVEHLLKLPSGQKKEFLKERTQKLRELSLNHQVFHKTIVREGHPAHEVLKLTQKRNQYEYALLGTKGYTGVSRVLLGSVSEEIIRNSRIPLIVLGPKCVTSSQLFQTRKILVATDLATGNKGSSKAEKLALGWAKKLKAEIVFVHCINENLHPLLQTAFSAPTAASKLQDLAQKIKKEAEVVLKKKVKQAQRKKISAQYMIDDRSFSASTTVVSAISTVQPDWIFLGTRGQNFFTQSFLGSTSRETILNSTVPVVVVP